MPSLQILYIIKSTNQRVSLRRLVRDAAAGGIVRTTARLSKITEDRQVMKSDIDEVPRRPPNFPRYFTYVRSW